MLLWRCHSKLQTHGAKPITEDNFVSELKLLGRVQLDDRSPYSDEMLIKLRSVVRMLFHPYMNHHLEALLQIIIPMLSINDKKVLCYVYILKF